MEIEIDRKGITMEVRIFGKKTKEEEFEKVTQQVKNAVEKLDLLNISENKKYQFIKISEGLEVRDFILRSLIKSAKNKVSGDVVNEQS